MANLIAVILSVIGKLKPIGLKLWDWVKRTAIWYWGLSPINKWRFVCLIETVVLGLFVWNWWGHKTEIPGIPNDIPSATISKPRPSMFSGNYIPPAFRPRYDVDPSGNTMAGGIIAPARKWGFTRNLLMGASVVRGCPPQMSLGVRYFTYRLWGLNAHVGKFTATPLCLDMQIPWRTLENVVISIGPSLQWSEWKAWDIKKPGLEIRVLHLLGN